jgi:hypothetical protein
MGVPADRRVFFASGLLEGSVKTWYRFLTEQASGNPEDMAKLQDWDTFSALLWSRFMAVNATRHARDTLAALKQTSSVHEYARKFQSLSCKSLTWMVASSLIVLSGGLKPRLARRWS